MQSTAYLLFENAHVFTADRVHPIAEAVAVRDNRIVFVGSRADAQLFKGSNTRVVDANGGTLMPGFIDSHFHMIYGALSLDGMQLEPASNYDELSQIILSYAAKHPSDLWLPGPSVRLQLKAGAPPTQHTHIT